MDGRAVMKKRPLSTETPLESSQSSRLHKKLNKLAATHSKYHLFPHSSKSPKWPILCRVGRKMLTQSNHILAIYNTTQCTQVLLHRKKQHHYTTTTVLRPFFLDHPGQPVPEENFWTLWCKGRLTEADTLTIRLGATPSGLTSAHLHHPPIFFTGRMPFLPPKQQWQSPEGKYIGKAQKQNSLVADKCLGHDNWY